MDEIGSCKLGHFISECHKGKKKLRDKRGGKPNEENVVV